MAIDTQKCFVEAVKGIGSFLAIADFQEVLNFARDVAVEISDPKPSEQAFKNVTGTWYEWLLTIGALEFMAANKASLANVLASLPNIKRFDCAKLYVEKLASLITDLRQKSKQSANVNLTTSNPDYVIVRYVGGDIPDITFPIVPADLDKADSYYLEFGNKCKFEDLIGYLSVKTSLTPDRRLQLAHEGSLMKAIYRHLQTRLWATDAVGTAYYAATMDFGKADYDGLRTVATHSLVSAASKPEAAVDELFKISSGPELEGVLRFLLLNR